MMQLQWRKQSKEHCTQPYRALSVIGGMAQISIQILVGGHLSRYYF